MRPRRRIRPHQHTYNADAIVNSLKPPKTSQCAVTLESTRSPPNSATILAQPSPPPPSPPLSSCLLFCFLLVLSPLLFWCPGVSRLRWPVKKLRLALGIPKFHSSSNPSHLPTPPRRHVSSHSHARVARRESAWDDGRRRGGRREAARHRSAMSDTQQHDTHEERRNTTI